MRSIRALLIFPVLLFFLSCAQDNPFSSHAASQVSLNIVLPKAESPTGESQSLNKTVAVTEVWLYVYADDMDDIEEILDISSDGTEASGSVEVPRGEARTFEIECYDANEILQYSGETTMDILEKTATVEITTVGHYPSASTLTITSFDAVSVALSWTGSTDADFASYELVRAGTAEDIESSSTRESIFTITSKATTTYTDDSVSPNTTYYYAIIVWDTEGMGMRSDAEGVLTPDLLEISYDDGSWEDYAWGNEVGDRFDMLFSSPTYPCYIKSIKLYLRDLSGSDGNYRVYIMDLSLNDLFYSEPVPTVPATTGSEGDWVTLDLNWENRAAGTVSEDFYAGIEYTGGNLWPDIFIDTDTDANRGTFYDVSTGSWYFVSGNLSVRVTMEIGGSLLKAPLGKIRPGDVAAALEQVTGEAPTSESCISLGPEFVLNPDPQAGRDIRAPRPARTEMQKYAPLRPKQKPTK